MLSSRPRSGSVEAGLRSSSPLSNSKNSSAKLVTSSDSKLLRSRSTSKTSPSPEKRSGVSRVSNMQQRIAQLEEELKREKEEKSKALQELGLLKKNNQASLVSVVSSTNESERLQVLEREVENAKESERKMLESLVYQTKQLEQTKISLEEAKLDIRSLQEGNRSLEATVVSANRNGQHLARNFVPNSKENGFCNAEEEMRILRTDLRLAVQGEEKSRKAMDDLAVALSDVTVEAKQVKIWLSEAQTELDEAKTEAEHAMASLQSVQAKLKSVTEENEMFKLETEESVAAWNEKEKVFVECMKASDAEVNKAKQENMKLVESQRVIREENARLRDFIKQAVSEATVVKDSLELARNENVRLQDVMLEKENALQNLKQEYECLKVSEATALGSLKELNNLLAAATTTTTYEKTATLSEPELEQQAKAANDVKVKEGKMKPRSVQWKSDSARVQNARRHSIGEPAKFNGVFLDGAGSPVKKDRMTFASISNVADLKAAAASVVIDDLDDDFDHVDGNHLDGVEHSVKQKKKRPVLRKLGDLFGRRGSHKSNVPPIVP